MNQLTTEFEKFDLMNFPTMSVGFDHIFNNLGKLRGKAIPDTYPPYNVVKSDEYNYRIEMALAGFEKDDLKITYEPGLLKIESNKIENNSNSVYLYNGIAARKFSTKFTLSDSIVVKSSDFYNGILSIELEKHVPDEMKPRLIPIN
tara:strand:+ start:204 stop:641 length:438 start_codon:yes stop_codon:yes gene_type:complete